MLVSDNLLAVRDVPAEETIRQIPWPSLQNSKEDELTYRSMQHIASELRADANLISVYFMDSPLYDAALLVMLILFCFGCRTLAELLIGTGSPNTSCRMPGLFSLTYAL